LRGRDALRRSLWRSIDEAQPFRLKLELLVTILLRDHCPERMVLAVAGKVEYVVNVVWVMADLVVEAT